jgi:ATP-binding cassette subfamily B protein
MPPETSATQPPPPLHVPSSDGAIAMAFLRRYALRYLPVYALGLLLLVATNVLTIAIPRLQKEVFDELAGGRDVERVHLFAAAIAACAVLVIFVRTGSRVLFFNPGRTIEFRLRNDMLARLLHMGPRWFARTTIGDLMARATDDATFVRALVGFSVIMALNIVLAASLAVAQMWATDAWLTAACVLPLLGSLWLLREGVRRTFALMKTGQEALGRLSHTVLETYKGIAIVQGAAAESAFLQRFDRDNDAYTRLMLKIAVVRTLVLPVVGVVGNLCVFLLLWLGGRHVLDGTMTLGDLAAYASYVAVLVGALASGGWVVGVLQRGLVSLRRTWEVVALDSDLPQGEVALPDPGRGVRLEVRDLTLRHPGAKDGAAPALDGVSFVVEPGHALGVYGAVGAGKSTLVAAIARLYDPPPGSVFLDGRDVRDIRDDDLRRALAVVPQEAFLFSRSIRDNVGFVDAAKDVDDARVAAAVSDACLTDDVQRMPSGLQTVVGEKGFMLSGGQRQRVQLARAFYRGFRLLVLDDVLSAVDHATEERLLGVLRREIGKRGTSAVIVSHRLTALAQADEVIVLDHGKIIERGTHAELIASGGTYAQVWELQQAEPDAAEPEVKAPTG